jgi:hypothetical protein
MERVVARPVRQMRAHRRVVHLLQLDRRDDGFSSSICAILVFVFMDLSLGRIALMGYFLFK